MGLGFREFEDDGESTVLLMLTGASCSKISTLSGLIRHHDDIHTCKHSSGGDEPVDAMRNAELISQMNVQEESLQH